MFGSNKVNRMTVIVYGVLDDDFEGGRRLMEEVVRRNCKIDCRLISQMVIRVRDYEDGKHKRSDFKVLLEAYDKCGMLSDFDLLRNGGVIKQVKKEQIETYLVY